MISILIGIIVFIGLYITVVWISFLFLFEPEKIKLKDLPSVCITIPAFNEEKSIAQTVLSVLNLDYPKDKLKIVVVNDGSTDGTEKIVKDLIKKHPEIKLISKKNEGKAKALNTALESCSQDLFACVDADSFVTPDSLKKMVPHFKNKKVAATISAIQVNKSKNIYEKLQRLEYILSIMTRKLMAFINTLSMTPGVLSVYNAKILKKVGGFDNKSMTEDFEIAMRLKYYGYDVDIETTAFTFTNVPRSFSKLWRQRVRWYRGFVENHRKYRKMFFNKKYGALAYFQLPINILGIALLIMAASIIVHGFFSQVYHFIQRSVLIEGFFWSVLTEFTSPRDVVLAQNVKIMLPVMIALGLAIIIFYFAHKEVRQKIRYPFTIWAFFIILSLLTALHWLGALTEEILKSKRKW